MKRISKKGITQGMRTLEKLGVHEALTDELGYRGPSGIPQIFRYDMSPCCHFRNSANGYSHWKTDQIVSFDTHTNVPDPCHHTTRFHRGHLHSALLNHVQSQSIHLNKRVARAEVNQDGVSLYFEDGSSAHGDILIGADGIRSVCFERSHAGKLANGEYSE